MRDAFDSEVLIYAAVPGHPLGERVASLFTSAAFGAHVGTGSVLLLPEGRSTPPGGPAQREPAAQMASRHGVAADTIHAIRSHRRWKHL